MWWSSYTTPVGSSASGSAFAYGAGVSTRDLRKRGALVLALSWTCLLVLIAPSVASARSSTSPGSGDLTPVHHVGIWIVDSEGRVVLTHGLNMIWKKPPYYPPYFSQQDGRFLASEGFTGARL